jgi:signal transduction histidine kinase
MAFSFNAYAIVLLICGTTTVILSNFIYSRGGNAVKWFTLMMASIAIWSIGYGLELASTALPQMILLIQLEYIGVVTLPVAWFFFCLNLSGKECWYHKPLNLVVTLIIPVVTLIFAWTNTYHHLMFKTISLATDGPFPLANLERGIWYYVFTGYFYLLLACGCYLIFVRFRNSDRMYQNQNYSILVAAFIPWLAHLASLAGVRPFGHVDITPFAFILTTVFILLGIYRFKLFDIIPVAREKVLELMQDGFFVLDSKNRVIDHNKAVYRYLEAGHPKNLIGVRIEELLNDKPELSNLLATRQTGKVEFSLIEDEKQYYLKAETLFIADNKLSNNFTIIKFQDLTSITNDAIRARAQTAELAKLNQLKDRIFSIIAHDLRGPLVNLSEVLKMIDNDQISNDEFKQLAPTLNKDIIYTTDLLENILHWSRSQLKGYGIKKELFNLRNLIINEINYHLPAATLKKIQIIHDVFPGEMVYADVLMIQIVMRNIINNAIKFCTENSEIHITAAYQNDQKILICVQDTGIGIPQNVLEKLFKEEQITTRGTLNERGTGLGLMVCKDFVNRNNGVLTVESSPGKGAKFCITLPSSI